MCRKHEKWASKKTLTIWVTLTKAKQWWLDDWLRATSKRQVLWGVPGAQLLIPTKWCKEGQSVNRHQDYVSPRLVDACGERRRACLLQLHRRATVIQLYKFNDSNVSEHTLHHDLLLMGLCICRLDRVPWWPICTAESAYNGQHEHQNWPMEQWKRVAWSDERWTTFSFRWVGRLGTWVSFTMGSNVMLWITFFWETLHPDIYVALVLTHPAYLRLPQTV